jgi:uncharacterized SAM-binding protein YcdF (DUF218 family)
MFHVILDTRMNHLTDGRMPYLGDQQTEMSDHSTASAPFASPSGLSPSTDETGAHSLAPKAPDSNRTFLRMLLAFAVLGLSSCAILIWGFLIFSSNALQARSDLPSKADAIVVVTGGKGRLEAAGSLFAKDLGDKLLISGVHPKFKLGNLPGNLQISDKKRKCCIELDRRALNTVANATQTAQWAKQHGYDNLIIVTSAYHMSRTMLEMRRASPDITFQSYSVPNSNGKTFWQRISKPDTLKLLIKEYGKLLLAFFQLSVERLAK